MNYFLVFVVVIMTVQNVWTLSETEEKYFIEQLTDFFDEDSIEIVTPNKRNVETGEEENAALIAEAELTDRGHHYWTRKRGHDRETTVVYEVVYPSYPQENIFIQNSYQNRNKRQALKKFLNVDKSSSRAKREATDEIVPNRGIESNDTKVENSTIEVKSQNRTQGQIMRKQLSRKL